MLKYDKIFFLFYEDEYGAVVIYFCWVQISRRLETYFYIVKFLHNICDVTELTPDICVLRILPINRLKNIAKEVSLYIFLHVDINMLQLKCNKR